MESYEIIIEGMVQGVGYRYFATNQARIYDIVGYVKNLYDGRVKIIAQGEENNLQNFIHHLHQGPRQAHIADLHQSLFVGAEKFSDFSVRF